jgi:hypothetical protein
MPATATTGYVAVTPTNVDLHGGAHPCPSCGHCPTCGRSNRYWDWPWNYYWPQPYKWYVGDPPYQGNGTAVQANATFTVLNGGLNNTGNAPSVYSSAIAA